MSVRRTVSVAAALVAVSTFVLLYYGLVDLARLAGIHDVRAWLYPLAIDGMVAAGYASTLVLRRGHLAYAWSVVGIGSGLSLLGQWLHAEQTSTWAYAGPVAAAPALSMALVWHLLFLVSVKHDDATETVSEVEFGTSMHALAEAMADEETPDKFAPFDEGGLGAYRTVLDDHLRDLAAPSVPGVPVSARDTSGTSRVRDTDRLDAAVSALRDARDKGETMTGSRMAEALQLPNAGTESGRRNGHRWLRKAEEALA